MQFALFSSHGVCVSNQLQDEVTCLCGGCEHLLFVVVNLVQRLTELQDLAVADRSEACLGTRLDALPACRRASDRLEDWDAVTGVNVDDLASPPCVRLQRVESSVGQV